MDNSFQYVSEWRKERLKRTMKSNSPGQEKQVHTRKWKPPVEGVLKIMLMHHLSQVLLLFR